MPILAYVSMSSLPTRTYQHVCHVHAETARENYLTAATKTSEKERVLHMKRKLSHLHTNIHVHAYVDVMLGQPTHFSRFRLLTVFLLEPQLQTSFGAPNARSSCAT